MKTEFDDQLDVHVVVDGKDGIFPLRKKGTLTDDDFDATKPVPASQSIYGYQVELTLCIHEKTYKNSRVFDSMEFATMDLQANLPSSIKLACCHSCQHGSFHPVGDQEDEIFCLRGFHPQSGYEVRDIMHEYDDMELAKGKPGLPKHHLLYWCEQYSAIRSGKFAYNDWLVHIKDWD